MFRLTAAVVCFIFLIVQCNFIQEAESHDGHVHSHDGPGHFHEDEHADHRHWYTKEFNENVGKETGHAHGHQDHHHHHHHHHGHNGHHHGHGHEGHHNHGHVCSITKLGPPMNSLLNSLGK